MGLHGSCNDYNSVAMGPFKISVLIVVAWLATTLILYYSKRNWPSSFILTTLFRSLELGELVDEIVICLRRREGSGCVCHGNTPAACSFPNAVWAGLGGATLDRSG